MKIQRLTQNSRLTAAILTAVMTAGCLTGCGGTNDTDAPAAAQTDAAPPETDTTETASSAQESETTQDTDDSENLTALELSKLMGNGINLGNTMEAYGRPELGINADTSKYETFWGQPVTTEEMIAGMKSCGFDSIRIPVAWTRRRAPRARILCPGRPQPHSGAEEERGGLRRSGGRGPPAGGRP